MHLPITIPVRWSVTPAEYEKLQVGNAPESWDDRWLIHSLDGTTHFHRTWTGKEVYRFRPTENEDLYQIREFYFVRTLGQLWLSKESKDTHRRVLSFLLENGLDVHVRPIPEPSY
jgi:hypothetical protein